MFRLFILCKYISNTVLCSLFINNLISFYFGYLKNDLFLPYSTRKVAVHTTCGEKLYVVYGNKSFLKNNRFLIDTLRIKNMSVCGYVARFNGLSAVNDCHIKENIRNKLECRYRDIFEMHHRTQLHDIFCDEFEILLPLCDILD